MKHPKAVATLLILPAVLAELVSAAVPVTQFLRPGMFLFLIFLGYGTPVLLLRELAVRWRLGLAGYFALGIAYGIFNEALLAKTFIAPDHLPLDGFDGYGRMIGINLPWGLTISAWHALVSVMAPIAIVHRLFPANSSSPWLDRQMSSVLGGTLMLFGSINFLSRGTLKGTPAQLILLLGLMAICVLVARHAKPQADERTGRVTLLPVLVGGSTLFFLLVFSNLAKEGIPIVVFYLLLAGVIGCYTLLFRRRWHSDSHLLLFALGAYVLSSALGMFTRVVQQSHAIPTLIAGLVFECLFLTAIWRIWREGRPAKRSSPHQDDTISRANGTGIR